MSAKKVRAPSKKSIKIITQLKAADYLINEEMRESISHMSIKKRFELAHSMGLYASELFASGEKMIGRIAYRDPAN
jgi:hypothetical protein